MKTEEFNLTDFQVLNNIDYLERLINHRKYYGHSHDNLIIELERQKTYLK